MVELLLKSTVIPKSLAIDSGTRETKEGDGEGEKEGEREGEGKEGEREGGAPTWNTMYLYVFLSVGLLSTLKLHGVLQNVDGVPEILSYGLKVPYFSTLH